MGCYSVNEHNYLNITFPENRLKASYLEFYIDSVAKISVKNDSVKTIFFNGDSIPEIKRIVSVGDTSDLYYLVVLNVSPCWIEAVCSKSSSVPIYGNSGLSEQEINEIKQRFDKEVLKKAELYGKKTLIPDSVIYYSNPN